MAPLPVPWVDVVGPAGGRPEVAGGGAVLTGPAASTRAGGFWRTYWPRDRVACFRPGIVRWARLRSRPCGPCGVQCRVVKGLARLSRM